MQIIYVANMSLILLTQGLEKEIQCYFLLALSTLLSAFLFYFSFVVSSFVAIAENVCSVGDS